MGSYKSITLSLSEVQAKALERHIGNTEPKTFIKSLLSHVVPGFPEQNQHGGDRKSQAFQEQPKEPVISNEDWETIEIKLCWMDQGEFSDVPYPKSWYYFIGNAAYHWEFDEDEQPYFETKREAYLAALKWLSDNEN